MVCKVNLGKRKDLYTGILSRESVCRMENHCRNSPDTVGVSIVFAIAAWEFEAEKPYLSVTRPEVHLRYLVEQAVIGQISGGTDLPYGNVM